MVPSGRVRVSVTRAIFETLKRNWLGSPMLKTALAPHPRSVVSDTVRGLFRATDTDDAPRSRKRLTKARRTRELNELRICSPPYYKTQGLRDACKPCKGEPVWRRDCS